MGCDGVAAYATIEWIEAIDTIDFWREGGVDPCPCPLGVSQGLGGGEVEDVDGVAFGVVGGVFEGELAFGKGVVGGRLHQAIDEDTHGTFGIGRFCEGDFGGEVHAVNGEDRRIGEGNVFLRGHADTYLPVSALPPVTDWSAPPMALLTALSIFSLVAAAVANWSVKDDQSSDAEGDTTPSSCFTFNFCMIFYF